MGRSSSRCGFGLAASLALLLPARADRVELKDGHVLEGSTTWTDDGLRVELGPGRGATVVPRESVASIEERETPWEELDRRRAALDPADLDGAAELGRFAAGHELLEAARELTLSVLARAPGHEQALAVLAGPLDFHQVEGEWVPPEDYYPSIGWVRLGGRWVSPEEAEQAGALRDLRGAERQRRKAERELRRAERELGGAREKLDQAQAAAEAALARQQAVHQRQTQLATMLEEARQRELEAQRALSALEVELVQSRSAYTLWLGNPCACPPRACTCGWDGRRLLLCQALALVDQRVVLARQALREARSYREALEAQERQGLEQLGQAEAALRARERERDKLAREFDAVQARLDGAEAARDQAVQAGQAAKDKLD